MSKKKASHGSGGDASTHTLVSCYVVIYFIISFFFKQLKKKQVATFFYVNFFLGESFERKT